jgi:hypothetical protein
VTGKQTFTESLAEYLKGQVIEQDPGLLNGIEIFSSVIRIPTYYGYHTFLGVLDSFVVMHTTLTSLKTWRMSDRNFYVIHLSRDDISIRIIYDSRNSLLLMTVPAGY